MQRTAPLPDYTYHTTIEYNVLDTKDVRFKNGIEGAKNLPAPRRGRDAFKDIFADELGDPSDKDE